MKLRNMRTFFSFGTNDLTQMTLGFSRDDVGSFLPTYVDRLIYEKDPFAVLDQSRCRSIGKNGRRKGT